MQTNGTVSRLYLVGVVVLMTACNDPVSAAKSTCPESGQQFWSSFRSAAESGDAEAVSRMTRFPFLLNTGITDDERKTRQLDRKAFAKVLPKLLESDSGMAETPASMKKYARSLTVLPSQFCTPSGRQFRVGDWVFQQDKGSWRFIEVYLDDDEGL